jgi:outer membrane protein OmpA-like peptidoglycan-associated protein
MKKFTLNFVMILILISFTANSNSLFGQQTNTVVSVTGSIKDEVSKKSITAEIKVFDNTGKKINSTKSMAHEEGYYFVTSLFPGKSYTLEISAPNYLTENLSVSIPNTDKYLEVSRDFNLKPLEKNIHIPLVVSPFEYNKSKLRFGSVVALENLANTLRNNPNVKFTILSYPDSDANTEENKKLTAMRADALKDYFIVQGIEATRIQIKESGQTDPKLPPPAEKRAKGKKYIGSTYIVINDF